MTEFFADVSPIQYEGPDTDTDLAYRFYDPDRVVLGKRMEDQLRIAVAYWHSFAWPGSDVFGAGTFDRPWADAGRDPMEAAKQKADVAFEFFAKLGTPFFCFRDADLAPVGETFAESKRTLEEMADYAAGHMAMTGVKLL